MKSITKLTHFIYGYVWIFHFSTRKKEGEFASGLVQLAENLRVIEVLEQLCDASNFPSLIKMIDTMMAKLAVYQEQSSFFGSERPVRSVRTLKGISRN